MACSTSSQDLLIFLPCKLLKKPMHDNPSLSPTALFIPEECGHPLLSKTHLPFLKPFLIYSLPWGSSLQQVLTRPVKSLSAFVVQWLFCLHRRVSWFAIRKATVHTKPTLETGGSSLHTLPIRQPCTLWGTSHFDPNGAAGQGALTLSSAALVQNSLPSFLWTFISWNTPLLC